VEEEPQNFTRHRRRQPRLMNIETLTAGFNDFDPNDASENYLFGVIQDRVEELIEIGAERDNELVDSIARLFNSYAVHLQTLCMSNTLCHTEATQLLEAEAVIGSIMQQTSQRCKRKELMAIIRESTE
jgi:hypothetical protein